MFKYEQKIKTLLENLEVKFIVALRVYEQAKRTVERLERELEELTAKIDSMKAS